MADDSFNQGRKREYEGDGPGGDMSKKPRYDESGEEEVAPATLRVLIRNSDAGGIIGKGGDNIKRLRKQYDCQVVLPDSAGAPERVMTMMGAISNIVGVLEDVLNGIANDFRSSQPGDGDKEVQILIPQPFMGTIIGTGGTKIKDLRQRTKTTIKIFSDPMPGSNERSVQLIGSNAQIVECVQHFLDDISKKEPREPIYLYEPGQQFGGAPDMNFPPPPRGRGRGGPPFRGGGGRGMRGGRGGGGDWRGGRGGGRGAGPPRGGRGGRYNGNNSGYQFGSPRPPSQYSGPQGGAPPPSGAVGYGGASQPSVGYTANQPPSQSMPPGAPGGYPPSGTAPAPSMPPATGYPTHQAAPSQSYLPSSQPIMPAAGQSQQVTIPAEFTDAILGVNGSNLQQIKSQSSCEISLEPPKPGVNERVITIVGSTNGIQFAQQLMQSSVRQHHPNV